MSSSTLVETVNINLDDFSETFLTCSTCLYVFDEDERRAKLLPCAHSVCNSCLEQLAALPQNASRSIVRCPLCREECILPPGGVSSLPGSFLINQLRDVIRRQRRDVVPSCSAHPEEGLLYCETCDHVFCALCNTNTNRSHEQHTVIAFSLALKRMSEIADFRTKSRLSALQRANVTVSTEITRLDQNVDTIVHQINATFQEVSDLVESRRRELIEMVRVTRDEKRKVLRDQLEAIEDEKKQLEREQELTAVQVKDVSRRASRSTASDTRLMQPNENAFISLNTDCKQLLLEMQRCLSTYGTITASTTFPAECTIELVGKACVHTATLMTLRTCDVDGRRRMTGGDPIEAYYTKDSTRTPINVNDMQDGTYQLDFRVTEAGEYNVHVNIFSRPIQNSPLLVTVSAHQSPVWETNMQFHQPTRVAIGENNTFYVLDTGNNRVRLVKKSGEVVKDVRCGCLEGGSAVGMALLPPDQLAILNWRERSLTTCTLQGQLLSSIVFSEFKEPIDLAVDKRGRFLVADSHKVFVLESRVLEKEKSVRPVFSFPANGDTITCVGVGMDDDILVGTVSSLLLFDGGGRMQRKISVAPPESKSKCIVTCCATCPLSGRIVAGVVDSRTNRAELSVSSYKGDLLFRIDSLGGRLRRPSGLAISNDGHVYCVDHPSNSLRMYKFR